MTIRKTLLSALWLVLIVGTANAQLSKIVSDSLYQIPKTNVAPVIDGVMDDVWKTLDWNFQSTYVVDGDATPPDGYTDLTGMSKAMWDETNLYILFFNQDDDIQDNPAQTAGWQKDAVEIYIDADNSKVPDGSGGCEPGAGLCPDDIQLTIPHAYMGIEADTVDGIGFPAGIPTDGVEFAIVDSEEPDGLPGWWLEVKIPVDNINLIAESGTLIGFELQQDESDGTSGAREDMSKWWNNTNNSWTDASIWGTAVLSDREVDTAVVIGKLPAGETITVDGVMEPVYLAGNPITQNLYRVDAAGTIENLLEDGFITTYLLWDETNYYAFFDVIDDDIQDNPAQTAGWQKDAVEFYIDPDNSKVADGSGGCEPGAGLCPDDIQLTIPHAYLGAEADTVDGIGFPAAIPLEGVEFKIADKDDGTGWYLELKIPVDNINLIAEEGTVLGLEVQLDESDGTSGARESMEKWWNATNNSWTDASIWGTAKLGPEVVVGVRPVKSPVPAQFSLNQNYPNPFNPSTKITFSIAAPDLVTLKVFNLLGQEIATLVNERMNAGTYVADFDAKNLPSGIYFYQVTAGNSSVTKKMMLLK
ncbi:MAG: sugar-binding protein [Ignavibacteria bacterium]